MFFPFISAAKVYCFSGDNIGNDVIFYRMTLFFTTVIAFLLFLLLWTLDFSFGTVDYVGKLKTFFKISAIRWDCSEIIFVLFWMDADGTHSSSVDWMERLIASILIRLMGWRH